MEAIVGVTIMATEHATERWFHSIKPVTRMHHYPHVAVVSRSAGARRRTTSQGRQRDMAESDCEGLSLDQNAKMQSLANEVMRKELDETCTSYGAIVTSVGS